MQDKNVTQESACQLRLMELMDEQRSPFADYRSMLVILSQKQVKTNRNNTLLNRQVSFSKYWVSEWVSEWVSQLATEKYLRTLKQPIFHFIASAESIKGPCCWSFGLSKYKHLFGKMKNLGMSLLRSNVITCKINWPWCRCQCWTNQKRWRLSKAKWIIIL